MVRTASVDENGVKKGLWSQEEDDKLRAFMKRHTHFNWRKVPQYAGLSRCGKSCRLRWMNYLRPDIKRGNFSKEEDDLIVQLHQQLGNKWSRIAMKLSGRTDNEIKNHWHTHLKKRVVMQAQNPHNHLLTTSNIQNQETHETTKQSLTDDVSGAPFRPLTLESSPLMSNQLSLSSSSSSVAEITIFEDSATDFWTQPFLTDDYTYIQYDYISSYNSYYGDSMDLMDQLQFQENN